MGTKPLNTINGKATTGMNEIMDVAAKQIKTVVGFINEMNSENTRNFEAPKTETEKFKLD